MGVRRVVTGHTKDGKATIVSDTEVDAVLPGGMIHMLWGADETPLFPDDGLPRQHSTFFPPVGGFRFCMLTVPPISNTQRTNPRLVNASNEFATRYPDFFQHMKKDKPGMHQTDSIDFEYIISGEVWLELDDGVEVHLKPGDTIVQNGTVHAWRNKGLEPCQIIGCLIGTNRKAG